MADAFAPEGRVLAPRGPRRRRGRVQRGAGAPARHHRPRHPCRDDRHRPLRAPVLRRPRLPRPSRRARAGGRQPRRRRGRARHRGVGKRLRPRARRRADHGEDELRQQRRRVQRRCCPRAARHQQQLGVRQADRPAERGRQRVRRRRSRSRPLPASSSSSRPGTGTSASPASTPTSSAPAARTMTSDGNLRASDYASGFASEHLRRPLRPRRVRPGRHAAARGVHHAAGAARRRHRPGPRQRQGASRRRR